MDDDPNITLLEDFDTEMLRQEGWKLYKMLQDDVENSYEVQEKAMKLAHEEADRCEVGLRPVTQNNSVFMEIYKKAK